MKRIPRKYQVWELYSLVKPLTKLEKYHSFMAMLFFSAIYGHLTSAQVPWPFSGMGKDEPANICALYEHSHGRRPPGRTHTSFSSQVRECIDPNKHSSGDDIVCTAQDRASWRRLTADFSSVNRCLWRCCSEITLVSDQLYLIPTLWNLVSNVIEAL